MSINKNGQNLESLNANYKSELLNENVWRSLVWAGESGRLLSVWGLDQLLKLISGQNRAHSVSALGVSAGGDSAEVKDIPVDPRKGDRYELVNHVLMAAE